MEEIFPIIVFYNGREHTFEFRLVTVGYTHRFYADINGTEVIFEPDEERKYRVVVPSSLAGKSHLSEQDMGLLEALAGQLCSLNEI